MAGESKKELFMILTLTVIFGVATYFVANLVDKSVSEVTEIRHEIDELTRVSIDDEKKIEEIAMVEGYKVILDDNLPEIDEIITILEQVENIAQISGVQSSINLEEGVIGKGEIEFEDEKEKKDFLDSLNVKEYSSDTEEQASTDTSTNVVLQMIEEKGDEQTEVLNINYLEINLILKGEYEGVRIFISLLQDSKYFFNIKEMRLIKTEDGYIECTLSIRAFIFEKSIY